MTVLQAIVMGIVQGLGEFLPISSSAHLILVPWFFGWTTPGLAFDLALHLGTLAAVTLYFWRDLIGLAAEGLTKGTSTPTGRLAWGIVLGTVPGALFGYLMEDYAETIFRNPLQVAILLAVVGAILYFADRIGAKRRSIEEIRVTDVIWIGLAQALAVIPGVSRSGSTITVALLLGLKRESAAKVSFLLGWPITFGAALLVLKDADPAMFNTSFFIGVATSAISGYAVIALLLDYLRRGTFLVFAGYRTLLAAVTIALVLLRA
ncbi:MAG: undecaprenyl-diphosphatase UppP [Bacillota bacterium]